MQAPMPTVVHGWPEMLSGARVAARAGGMALGALNLGPSGMAVLAASVPVLSVRIDDHEREESWHADRSDGSFGLVSLQVPREPVDVPRAALADYVRFMEWAQSTHGFVGRLLLWDTGGRWWLVHDEMLEVTLVCAAPEVLSRIVDEHLHETDGEGWQENGPRRAGLRDAVERVGTMYGVPTPPVL